MLGKKMDQMDVEGPVQLMIASVIYKIKLGFINPFPNKGLFFTCLWYKSFENTVGKGEIAHNEQFLLFPQRFQPIWRSFCRFHPILNCRLKILYKSLKFVVWERVNP